MALNASWVHGTALTVESPQNLARKGYFGWGADMVLSPNPEGGSWFHIPLPTPVIVGDNRTFVQTFFLLCWTDGGVIQEVDIWDGPNKVREFVALAVHGEHRLGLDNANTFKMEQGHSVNWGMGISFFFANAGGSEGGLGGRLILAAAGGDFFRPDSL